MIATATDPPYKIRIPEPLMAKVKESAAKNSRSLNSEMLVRLAASFQAKKK